MHKIPFPWKMSNVPSEQFFAVYYLYAMKEQGDWRIVKNYWKLSIILKKNIDLIESPKSSLVSIVLSIYRSTLSCDVILLKKRYTLFKILIVRMKNLLFFYKLKNSPHIFFEFRWISLISLKFPEILPTIYSKLLKFSRIFS